MSDVDGVHARGGCAGADNGRVPRDTEETATFMDSLTFGKPPSADEEAELLAALPPAGSGVMVVRSLRLPMDVDLAVGAAAKEAGVTKTAWIRQAIEMALSMQDEKDEPISRIEALRALTMLRPARHVA